MKNIFILFLLIGVYAFGYSGYYAPYKAGTSKRVSQGYDGTFSHGGKGYGYALDFTGTFDVYPSKDGVVASIQTRPSSKPNKAEDKDWHGPAGFVSIKHDDGLYSQYYHLDNISVAVGQEVKRGETFIGTTALLGWTTGVHLHLQFSTNATSMAKTYSRKVTFDDIGFPQENGIYTSGNYPVSSEEPPASIFDGAGSIVRPSESCSALGGYGCYKDIAMMHPYSDYRSSVVFQWQQNAQCPYLKLTSSYPISAFVKQKNWASHLAESAFFFDMNGGGLSGDGLVIKPSGQWTTLSVTSSEPVPKEVKIYAQCTNIYPAKQSVTTVDMPTLENKLLYVTHDYYWSGTSSLISYPFKSGTYGVSQDIVVLYRAHKALATTQWFAYGQCSSVEINGLNGYNIDNSIKLNEVSIKDWDAGLDEWESTDCTSLPCRIDAPVTGRYFILKYKAEPTGKDDSRLFVKCVN